MTNYRRTGCCEVCRSRFRLRKDGTMGMHHLYTGLDRDARPCEGVGKLPRHAEHNRRLREAHAATNRIEIIPLEPKTRNLYR